MTTFAVPARTPSGGGTPASQPKEGIMTTLHTVSGVEARIFTLANRPPFMVATELAEIYAVRPEAINQAVKRNLMRFPEDFCFVLTEAESAQLKSQNVISNMANRGLQRGFTHAGALALSGVLKTPIAAEVSVIVHRAFAAMEARALADVRFLLARVQTEAMLFRKARARVVTLFDRGCDFEAIWQAGSISRKELAGVARDCLALGLIADLPKGTPEERQMALFASPDDV